ncbi:MAG TPA: hypothetical protein VF624_13675 [Tepidisphaeraceae bacterium]
MLLAADLGWAFARGGGGYDRGAALAVDPSGNAVVAGVFNGTLDFDPTAGVASAKAPAANSAFIAKYTTGKAVAWVKALGGSGEQNVQGVATDGAGNVYAAGYFSGTLDFDPGSGTSKITAKGRRDGFIVKLSSSGSFVWAKALGGASDEGVTALATDAAGNVYAAGMFNGAGDFDPGAGTRTLTSAGGFDVFAVKLSGGGHLAYAVRVGNGGYDTANGVAVDSAGRATLVGSFAGTIDLNPAAAVATRTAAGGTDVFVLQLDAGGAYRNGVDFGGSGVDAPGDVRLDAGGNAVVVGQFTAVMDADPSGATRSLAAAGATDGFIVKLTPSLGHAWSRRFGSGGADRATNLAVDRGGAVYVTGQYSGRVDFSGGAGTGWHTSVNGSKDAFALKITTGGAFAWARAAGGPGGDDVGEAIGVTGAGRLYTSGAFTGTLAVAGPGRPVYLPSAGGSDLFLWQLINL